MIDEVEKINYDQRFWDERAIRLLFVLNELTILGLVKIVLSANVNYCQFTSYVKNNFTFSKRYEVMYRVKLLRIIKILRNLLNEVENLYSRASFQNRDRN